MCMTKVEIFAMHSFVELELFICLHNVSSVNKFLLSCNTACTVKHSDKHLIIKCHYTAEYHQF